jgi:hypothetical protein
MDENFVRELLSRTESGNLDFKREHHSSDVELAKDLMAISNVLPPDERGHIVFGADQDPGDGTGVIVGLSGQTPDDAALHHQVTHKLNRVPAFGYQVFVIDSRTVGVLEVVGEGKRPYFPIRDAGSVLTRFLPLKRSGSGTDRASPLEVIEWSHQDDPVLHEKARLELEESRLRQHPRLNVAVDTKSRARTKGGPLVIMENVGRCILTVKSVSIRWKSAMAFVKLRALSSDADSDGSLDRGIQTHTIGSSVVLPPGGSGSATMRLSKEEFTRGFGDVAGIGRIEFEILDVTIAADSEYGKAMEEKLEVNEVVRW